MNEHVTLAPQLRFEGSLEDVPSLYRHAKCGVVTQMPEEIIRTYLVSPLTYNDGSFCGGCGTYVDTATLTWIDTGEMVLKYMARLRSEYLFSNHRFDVAQYEISITPGTAEVLHQLAAEVNLPVTYYVILEKVDGGTEFEHKLDMAPTWDRNTHDLIKVDSINLLVRKNQRKRLRGLAIHYSTSPRGFCIARVSLQ